MRRVRLGAGRRRGERQEPDWSQSLPSVDSARVGFGSTFLTASPPVSQHHPKAVDRLRFLTEEMHSGATTGLKTLPPSYKNRVSPRRMKLLEMPVRVGGFGFKSLNLLILLLPGMLAR